MSNALCVSANSSEINDVSQRRRGNLHACGYVNVVVRNYGCDEEPRTNSCRTDTSRDLFRVALQLGNVGRDFPTQSFVQFVLRVVLLWTIALERVAICRPAFNPIIAGRRWHVLVPVAIPKDESCATRALPARAVEASKSRVNQIAPRRASLFSENWKISSDFNLSKSSIASNI